MLSRLNYRDERGRNIVTDWSDSTIADSCLRLSLYVRTHYSDEINTAWFEACCDKPRDFDTRAEILQDILNIFK
jgi:hypothetical protein